MRRITELPTPVLIEIKQSDLELQVERSRNIMIKSYYLVGLVLLLLTFYINTVQ